MRADDHTMTILTGLVFAVVLGTMAQNSDSIMELFSEKTEMQVEDDVFFVRAGTNTNIDLLANDYSDKAIAPSQVRITANPSCGSIDVSDDGVLFHSSAACTGMVKFAYCIEASGTCAPAEVLLNIREAPTAVADAYLPKKGDLVPLPLTRVTKSDPVNRVGSSLEQSVKINAFVVTFGEPELEATSRQTLASANELTKYLIDTSTLDINGAPSEQLPDSSSLHTINVPLSATRSARFLLDYDEEQDSSDPARTYNNSTFNVDDDWAAESAKFIDENNLVVPAEDAAVKTQDQPTQKPSGTQDLPEVGEVVALGTDPAVADLTSSNPSDKTQIAAEDRPVETPALKMPEGATTEAAFEPALSLPPRETETASLNIKETSSRADIVPDAPLPVNEQANACGIKTNLTPAPGAHVALSLSAPCHAGQEISANHAGVDFIFVLNEEGVLDVELPALKTDPKFKIVVGKTDPLFLSVSTNDVVRVHRSVVITRNTDGIRLGAVEFDAKSGQDRLITAQNSLPHRDAYLSGRGYVRAYTGKDGNQIEIYTLPMSHRVAGGVVKLNLIEGLDGTACAKQAMVDFLHVGSRPNRLQTTAVSIPDCSSEYALGDVIGNIRIATR